MKLGVRGHEIEIRHFSLASGVAFPREVFRFCYTYSRPDKPISSVTLDFSDYSRQVSVSGEAADRVEALSKLAEKDLLRYSTTIGGATFRRIAGVCLSLTFLTSLIVSSVFVEYSNLQRIRNAGLLGSLGYSCYFSSHGTGTLRASPFTKATRLFFSSDMPLRFSSSALSRLFLVFPYPIFFPNGQSAIISNEVLHGRQLNSSKYYASSGRIIWPKFLQARGSATSSCRPLTYSANQLRACASSLGGKNFTGVRRTPAPAKASARVSQRGSATIAILEILCP